MDGHHAAEEAWLRERLARDADPVESYDFLNLLKKTGKVNLYGCRLAAATFEVGEADLLSEADGIVDSVWFLNEKAAKADHCQYFLGRKISVGSRVRVAFAFWSGNP